MIRYNEIWSASLKYADEHPSDYTNEMYDIVDIEKAFKAGAEWADSLEVKNVDLEKELNKYTADNFWALEGNNESPYLLEKDDMLKVAKYFFELGMASKCEVKHDDTSLIDHK